MEPEFSEKVSVGDPQHQLTGYSQHIPTVRFRLSAAGNYKYCVIYWIFQSNFVLTIKCTCWGSPTFQDLQKAQRSIGSIHTYSVFNAVGIDRVFI